MKRLSPSELDDIALRLAGLEIEYDELRAKLKDQVENFGSTPPKAEKSKRLTGALYQFTVSTSSSTEILDAEVERIRDVCPNGLFLQLFVKVTKYKLAKGATVLLAGVLPEDAPRTLRQMFSRAVRFSEGKPSLKIEKLSVEAVG